MHIGGHHPFAAAPGAEPEREQGAVQQPGPAGARPALEPNAPGHVVLHQPHLRAGIASGLRTGQQRAFLEMVARSNLRSTLGSTPRYETLRALPAEDRTAILSDPATAAAVLREVLAVPPSPESALESALAAAALARDMPTPGLQQRALEHVQAALDDLPRDVLGQADMGLILARVARMCTDNALRVEQPAELLTPPNQLALTLIERHLAQTSDPVFVREALMGAAALFHADFGTAQRVFNLVQTHAGRLPDAARAPVLGAGAYFLSVHPQGAQDAGMPALQASVRDYLVAQYEALSDPRQRAGVLVALSNLESAGPAENAMLARMLDAHAPHLSAQECGEIAAGIAESFLDRFAFLQGEQDSWMGRLEAWLPRSADACVGSALRSLVDHLTANDIVLPDELHLKPRILDLVRSEIARVPDDEKRALLAGLGEALRWAASEMDWPEFVQPVLDTIVAHTPLPSAAPMANAEQARDFSAVVASVASVLHELPAQGLPLQPAFNFIAAHLSVMPVSQRIATLNQLATMGLESDLTRERSRVLLEAYLPSVATLPDARDLFEEVFFSTHFAGFPTWFQQSTANALAHDLRASAPDARADSLGELVAHFPILARGVDREAAKAVFSAFGAAARALAPTEADTLMRAFEASIVQMPAEHGARALATLAEHWSASGLHTGRMLADTLIRLADGLLLPAMPLAIKHEVMGTLLTGIRGLAALDDGEQFERVRATLGRCLADPRLDPSLSRGVAQLQQLAQWIQMQRAGGAGRTQSG